MRNRCYAIAKLWVKENGSPPVKVATKGCADVDDFIKRAKVELNTHCGLTAHTSMKGSPLKPWMKLGDLFKTPEFQNDGEHPIFLKIIPPSQHSAIRKTIFIREINDDGDFTDEYNECELKSDAELAMVIKNGEGLVHLSQPRKLIVGFDQLNDGEKYQLLKYQQNFVGWSNNEANAMEDEAKQAMIRNLKEILGPEKCVELRTDIFSGKRQVLELDFVLYSGNGNTLYLGEAKHFMSATKIEDLARRVHIFPDLVSRSSQWDSYRPYLGGNIVGVACGTDFPKECRALARQLNLVIIYPSGDRYDVDGVKRE